MRSHGFSLNIQGLQAVPQLIQLPCPFLLLQLQWQVGRMDADSEDPGLIASSDTGGWCDCMQNALTYEDRKVKATSSHENFTSVLANCCISHSGNQCSVDTKGTKTQCVSLRPAPGEGSRKCSRGGLIMSWRCYNKACPTCYYICVPLVIAGLSWVVS